MGEETRRKLEKKIEREKLMKELVSSAHCEEKLRKGINNYIHEMQKSQEQRLLFKRKPHHSSSQNSLLRTSLINTPKASSKISCHRILINSEQPRCKTV